MTTLTARAFCALFGHLRVTGASGCLACGKGARR
jgi:hypothetical protein